MEGQDADCEQLSKELAAALQRIAELEAIEVELSLAVRDLRASEQRFRAQFKGLPTPVYSWQAIGEDFVLVDYNEAADRITHGSVVQLLGARASELYRNEPDILAELRQCYADRRSFSREMLYRYRVTREHKYLGVSYGFVPPDLVLVHTEDVTAHRQAEHALRRERDLVSAILDTAGALVVVLDLEGRIVRFNRACEQTTGYSCDEVEGKCFWELFLLPEETEPVKAVFSQLAAGQFPSTHENYWITKDGRRRLIVWSNTALLSEEGSVDFVIGTGIDITERRRAEDALRQAYEGLEIRVQKRTAELSRVNQALRESEERFRLAFEHAPFGMALVGTDGGFWQVNQSLCKMLGYSEQELLHKTFQELTFVDDLDVGVELFQDLKAGRRDFGWLEIRYVSKDGHLIWVQLTISVVRDPQGKPAYLVSQFQDLTERVLARQTLEERVAARTRELSALYDVTAVASASLDLETVLEQSLNRVLEVMSCETGGIHLWDEAHETFQLAVWRGVPAEMAEASAGLARGSSLVDWVISHGELLVVTDMARHPAAFPSADQWPGTHAYVGAPIHAKGQVLGVLSVIGAPGRQFSAEEVALLASIADQVGVAVENARLYQRTEQVAVLEERERLARELHDSVTQSLYSSNLMVETAHRAANAGDLQRAGAYLRRLGEITQAALKEMRLLVYELRPPVLEQERLTGALQKRLDAVEGRTGVEARLLTEGDVNLPAAVEEALYRIAQEALNNALKHATATDVEVLIRADEAQVLLEVTDNGCGFDPEAARNAGGMGLISMHQRAELVGGVLSIHSAPGEGTRVQVRVRLGLLEGPK